VSTNHQRIAMIGNRFPGRVFVSLGALQRIRDLRSRMREFRTSGSVGDPGGQPLGSTRRLR